MALAQYYNDELRKVETANAVLHARLTQALALVEPAYREGDDHGFEHGSDPSGSKHLNWSESDAKKKLDELRGQA